MQKFFMFGKIYKSNNYFRAKLQNSSFFGEEMSKLGFLSNGGHLFCLMKVKLWPIVKIKPKVDTKTPAPLLPATCTETATNVQYCGLGV